MKTQEEFKIGKNNISYIGSNFKEWFGDMEFKETKPTFTITKLERDMVDKDIFSEIKPNECELGDVLYAIQNNIIDKKLYGGIFYIKDNAGVLRAVYVRWDGVGWNVHTFSVENPVYWHDGLPVFSRNSGTLIPSPSDSLTLSSLETRIKNLEDKFNNIFK